MTTDNYKLFLSYSSLINIILNIQFIFSTTLFS
jgi:hypothetical protein